MDGFVRLMFRIHESNSYEGNSDPSGLRTPQYVFTECDLASLSDNVCAPSVRGLHFSLSLSLRSTTQGGLQQTYQFFHAMILADLFRDFFAGMDHGSVIAAAEGFADVHQR